MINRRNFLQQAGMLGLALAVKPGFACSKPAGHPVGLQLYTLREQIGKDPKQVIARIAEAGYQELEMFGFNPQRNSFFGIAPKAFKEILDSNQLTSPSGHYGLDLFLAPEGKEDDLKVNIEAGAALGHSYLTVPYLDDRFRRSADDYKRIAERFNKAAELCKSSGLQFAYHNHAFEFEKMGTTTGYDILLKETDPDLVKFEMDIYWVVRAGKDPVDMFRKHKGRFVMWHVKDMDRQKHELNTEVGSGSIDFRKIFQSAELSGVKHILVEQENFSMDPFASISQSCRYIKEKLLPVMA